MFQNTFYTCWLSFVPLFHCFGFSQNIRGSVILCSFVFKIFSQLFICCNYHLFKTACLTTSEKVVC